MKRKSIFLVLSVIVLGLCSTLGLVGKRDSEVYAESVSASTWDGTYKTEVFGSDYYTEDGVTHILTADGFGYFAQRVTSGTSTYLNETVVLECDIDLGSHEWAPIGSGTTNIFRGTFDGNGHTIFNMNITNSQTYVGLFGYMTGSVSNLVLEDVDINVSNATAVGGLIASANFQSKTLSNVSVSGSIVVSNGMYVGGVVGRSEVSANRDVSTILSTVDITTSSMQSGSAVGGIFGSFSAGTGTLELLGYTGDIDSGATYIGGLFGELGDFSVLKNSYADFRLERNLDGTLITYLGGLAGNVNVTTAGTSEVYNTYTAELSGSTYNKTNLYKSGLFGNIRNNQGVTIKITNTLSFIENSTTQDSYTFNPLYYNPNNATVEVSYTWFKARSLSDLSDEHAMLELDRLAIQKSFYENENYFDQTAEYKWDFENVWCTSNEFEDNGDYWHLRLLSHKNIGNPNNDKDYSYSDGLDGDGTPSDPYRIRTAGDLGYLSINYSADFQGDWFSLEADIDLMGKTWQPLGANPSIPFSGVFLGNGHTIYNITCSLQYQYSYHGFFGVTENAFIRDLTIGDIHFINEGTGETGTRGYMGAIVGYAKENTYLDNCVDNSGIEDLDSVGLASGLTAIYGKNNYNGTSTPTETLKLDGISSYNIGYDVEIDFNGGIVYSGSSLGSIYDYFNYDERFGNRMLFLYSSLSGDYSYTGVPSPLYSDYSGASYVNVGINTMGYTEDYYLFSAPESSDYLRSASQIVVKKGYKLSNYSLINGGQIVSTSSAGRIRLSTNVDGTWLAGIRANYTKMPNKTVVVHYNEYEKQHFGADDSASYLTKSFEVEYDSILWNDYNEIFNRQPTTIDNQPLRGDDFYIDDFYLDVGFEQRLVGGVRADGTFEGGSSTSPSKASFVNDTIFPDGTIDLYVKWLGSEDAVYQLKIKFSKVDDIALGNFDLTQAIKSVSLTAFDENGQTVLKTAESFTVESDETVIVNFDYNTLYSNLVTNGLQLKIEINTGYEFAEPMKVFDFGSGQDGTYDFSFGHLTLGGNIENTILSPSSEYTYSQSTLKNGLSFLNLVGDYQVDVVLQKQRFTTEFNIVPDDIYFSLAPNISNVTEVAVYDKGSTPDLNTTPLSTYSMNNAEGEYVGLDVLNNVLVSSDTNVGAKVTLANNLRLANGESLIFRYTLSDGTYRYFRYIMGSTTESVAGEEVTYLTYELQEINYQNSEWVIVDFVATLYVNEAGDDYVKFTYLTNAEFTFLVTIRDLETESYFTSFEVFGDSFPNAKTNYIVSEENFTNPTKFMHIFTITELLDEEILNGRDSQIWGYPETNPNVVETINIVTKYTKATFSVKVVDEDGNEVENAPSSAITSASTSFTVSQSGSFSVPVSVTSSNYYKMLEIFDNSSGGRLLAFRDNSIDGEYNVYVIADSVGLDSFDSEEQADAYIADFNANNSNYASGSQLSFTRGTRNNNQVYPFDQYSFSLSFSGIYPGRYTIYVVCEPVNYALNYQTRFVTYNASGYTKENFVNASGENLPTISAVKNLEDGQTEEITSGQMSLSYDDSISVDTALGENKAYSFYDYYIQGENWEGFLSSLTSYDKEDFNFTYSDIYDYILLSGDPISTTGRTYQLTVSAIYEKKEVSFTLDEQVSIIGETDNTLPNGLSISFSEGVNQRYQYNYGVAPNVEISFEKSGTSADAYYFVGFNILNENGDTVQTYQVEDGQVFESQLIDEWILERLEDDETMGLSTNYSIMPILAKKQANLHFLSGTGEGLSGLYTDGKDGQVYDFDGNLTTDTEVLMQNVTFGETIYLYSEYTALVGDVESSVVVDDLFYDRTGYSRPANSYWNSSNGTTTWTDINGSVFYLTSQYFVGTADDEILIDIYVYRIWTANTYSLYFNRNEGVFEGDNAGEDFVVVEVTYDSPISSTLTSDDISITGQHLIGWTLEANDESTLLIDEEGTVLTYADIVDENGNYINADDLNVYALWEPSEYQVRIVTNGANTIAGEPAEENIDFNIFYGDTFEAVFTEYSLSVGENSPIREGFSYVGVFANGAYEQAITSSTIFNTNIPGCELTEDGISLTLYLKWEFDNSYLDLRLSNSVLEKPYTADETTFTLAEYFENGYSASGYLVDVQAGRVTITLDEDVHAEINMSLVSDTMTISNNSSFSARNVGRYTVTLILSVEDLISEGVVLYTQSITLYAEITQTDLDVSISSDNEIVWLANVKRIMNGFVSSDVQDDIDRAVTFTAFVNDVMKNLDDTIPQTATNKDVYEFVMYKYYQMTTSVDYPLYKEMTYSDFAELKQTSQEEIENLVSMLYFFDYYDHEAEGVISLDVYNDAMVISSETVTNPRAEVSIDRVEIFSEGTLDVGMTYYFRAYLESAGGATNLGNYNLTYDQNGEAYIFIGEVYIMPELLVVENQANIKNSYYNENLDRVSIEWQGNRQSTTEYGNDTFYQIGENLFASANLYTSNNGKEKEDVEFSFVSNENYLYYADVSIFRRELVEGEYVYYDITNYFKLILDENDIYTILNIDGIALIEVSANYLTMVDGFVELTSLPSSVSQELLRITQITYDLNDGQGVRRIVDTENGYLQEGMFEIGGLTIAQIERNNSNTVSAILSKFVQSVTVMTTEKDANSYIGLYKWTEEEVYNVDGTMESNTSFTIEKDSIMTSEETVTEYNLYATYTDLVYVSYNLNFPSNHSTSSLSEAWLQLGQSTIDDLMLPDEDGFRLHSLTATKPDGTTVSYEELFDGVDGIFRGISTTAPHTKVVLNAMWEIDDIQYEQLITQYSTSVHGFDYLTANSVVAILNLNPDLFNYTYEWYKGDELLATGTTLTLDSLGTVEDNGLYKLVVTATVKREFLSTALISSDGASNSIEIEFTMEFVKNLLSSLTFVGEQEFVYDATDHINDWYISAEYFVFDTTSGDYNEFEDYLLEYYLTATDLNFKITFGGEEVSQMRDAGTYTITVSGLDSVYSNATEFGEQEFVVTILPYEVELSENDILFSKNFNTSDPILSRELYFAETIELSFEREKGERVGEYELYLTKVSEMGKNYVFKMNDVAVFENGKQTAVGATTSVGTFEIQTSGSLRLYYEVTEENPQTINVNYNADGYRVELDGLVLNIYNGDSLLKSVELKLFDATQGEDVSNAEILQILTEMFADIDINFFDTTAHQSVTNSGTYSYSFTNLEEILDYYTNVVFAPGYQFTIGQISIDVSRFDFDKVYDGQTQVNLTTSGEKIADVEAFTGIYISATYASGHAGNTTVMLSLINKDSSEQISNYQLSSQFVTATIGKLSATLTITMEKTQFEYGEVSVSNLNSYINETFEIKDSAGSDVSSLLVDGYYRISFALPTNAFTNPNGFVYKGEYTLQVNSSFDDFNMTISAPTFTINEKTIQKTVAVGQFSILSGEMVASSYSEVYLLNETGDTLELVYNVVGVTAGATADVGFYDITLQTNTFANGSVVVEINANNDGFAVKAEENLVYIVLDTSILTMEYNGNAYVLSVNVANKTLTITNGTSVQTRDITFEYATGEALDDLTFQTLDIYYGANIKSFTDIGTFGLTFTATSETHSNFMFKENYEFEITAVEVDATEFNLTQTYNGTDSFVFENFAGKVASDNVSIVAKYAQSGVGTNIDVTLYLQGDRASNYVLLNAENLKGEIEKADAYITLSQTQFTYGTLTSNLGVSYTVTSSTGIVPTAEYSIKLNIVDEEYSLVGYLLADTYNVVLDEASSSANYNLIFEGTQSITVSSYSFNVLLMTSGQYSYVYGSPECETNTFEGTYLTPLNEYITLTMTRQAGNQVGYYKVLSSASNSNNYTVSSTVDGSDGAFRITKANEIIYILMNNEEVVSGADGQIATITYDGNIYDTVSVSKNAISGKYQLTFESSANPMVAQYYELNYYSYDSDANTYTLLTDVTVDGLKATLVFANGVGGGTVGDYLINIQSATADNYMVNLGLYGQQTFYLRIEKRQLYFKEQVVTKVFDNENAEFYFDDVTEMLDGVLEADIENLSLNIRLTESGQVAKYVGYAYTVEAILTGGDTNYNLNMTTSDGSAVYGTITPAKLLISVDSQTFIYGEDIVLDYTYTSTVDLTYYEKDISINIVPIVTDDDYSSSGALKVGEYDAVCVLNSPDFRAVYLVNGEETDTLEIQITVLEKELSLQAVSGTLQELFTKVYDGTNLVNLQNTDGTSKLNLLGVVTRQEPVEDGGRYLTDDVTLVSAIYASEYIGQSITINFLLEGEDIENYYLAPWDYGVIEAIYIGLNFNYNSEGYNVKSNVENSNLQQISTLAFPFMSQANLTSNSATTDTTSIRNFPTMLTGKTGNTFVGWTMTFNGIVEGEDDYNYLLALLNSIGMEYTYSADTESVVVSVGNDADTISLLRNLLENESDVMGYYYQNHEDISFQFDAVWDINKITVNIKIADENGADSTYGTVSLEASSGESVEITSTYSGTFDYGTKLTLTAKAIPHCTYYGFYNANGSIHYDNNVASGVTVSSGADGIVLTVESLSTAYNFVARFKADEVQVTVDLTGAMDASISSSGFVATSEGIYSWNTTYLALEDFTLADIGLSRVGYEVKSFISEQTSVESADFETTNISALLSDGQSSITLTPEFEAVGVVVTLDFNDGQTENAVISVPFGQSYSTASGWIETPTYLGHKFEGWLDSYTKEIVTGDSVISSTDIRTLTAQWSKEKYNIQLTTENAVITSDFLTSEGNVYTAQEVEFDSELAFTVTPNAGYTLENFEGWNENFQIETEDDGSVTVTFNMPAGNIESEIIASAVQNQITIAGEHIEQILAYDVTGEETEISFEGSVVPIETGRTLKLVITAEYGYQILDEILCDDENITISKEFNGGVLTLTISNITKDAVITLNTFETINEITIKFSDNEVIEDLIVGGANYRDYETLAPFNVNTGDTLEMYLKYAHGYEYDSYLTSGEFEVVCELATEGDFATEGYYKVVISNISNDGEITLSSKLSKFTLNVVVRSFDETKQEVTVPENKVLIDGSDAVSEIEVDFGTTVKLTYSMAEIYSFAGWSKDGINVFSMDSEIDYEVSQNETIYAIFSSMIFNIRFSTYNYYTLGVENGSTDRIVYQEIAGRGESFVDVDTNQTISSLELYFGSSKTIRYTVPTGYRYYGIGYRSGNDFIMLNIDETSERQVEFTISSLDLDEELANVTLYVVVRAYSFDININTEIDIDSVREPNEDVGGVTLQSSTGETANEYGYVDGTRVHYSENDFENGNLIDDREFTIVGYTGEDVYIRIDVKKAGYRFYDVVSNTATVTPSEVESGENYAIYVLRGVVGGTTVDIDVLFRPNLNNIKIGFKHADRDVDGGAITYVVDAENVNKVWASGRDYSSITVAGYTDSSFDAYVYIKLGYYVDPENIEILCEQDIIDRDSIEYTTLSAEDGYTGRIKFTVKDYLSASEIYISLQAYTYTVRLVEDEETLVVIRNVEFGSRMNLYQQNQENIEIAEGEDRIMFVDGKLTFQMRRENYNFEGFFTSENGAGVRYIDGNGDIVLEWNESGYRLNSLTSEYELTENAFFNTETGEMEITLYLYWSYNKTRISFEIMPDIDIDATAQDMVTGIDYTNSWFYPTSPMYIEVAFNTNVYIVAPEISGYKFYKFVIKQKDIDGNWLEDVVSFSNEVPWSTNENDKIVECNIQIVYFAQVDVMVYGGEGSFEIVQESSDAQAMALVEQKYVDTTKPFDLVAVYDENNFDFVRWNNVTSGQSYYNSTWENLMIDSKTTLILNIQGKSFVMSFVDENDDMYDYTFGRIVSVMTESVDGSSRAYSLGNLTGNQFTPTRTEIEARVGDKVTFVLSIDYGFGVQWNQEGITFTNYTGGLYYFEMTITSCPSDEIMRILPEFENEILSIYITRDFLESDKLENTIDLNSVALAGYTTYNGRRTDFVSSAYDVEDITIGLVTNPRYSVSSIVVRNYEREFENFEDFTDEDGNIVFTREFIQNNGIVGIIQIDIKYQRLLWESESLVGLIFEGEGTDNDPFQISSAEELALMMQLSNSGAVYGDGRMYRSASYILTDDIVLSDEFWTPIGTEENSFNGYFNFNGHTVSGIYHAYYYDSVTYNGLFGVLSPNAVILLRVESTWYIYLIIGIVAVLVVVLTTIIVVSRRKKRQREKLANK